MTLDGHLLLSHPAESWPVCTPPECVSASVCTSPFYGQLLVLGYCILVFEGGVICVYVHMHNEAGYTCAIQNWGVREMPEYVVQCAGCVHLCLCLLNYFCNDS